jgi:RNA polymerase sigma factor (sigma-70 family)
MARSPAARVAIYDCRTVAPHVDDLVLLQRWGAGDLAAGDTLFNRHFNSVHRFFRSKLDGDIEDLVQRTFLALLECHARGRQIAAVRGWLLGTARHLLLERWRAREDFDPGSHTLAGLEPSPCSVLVARAEQRLLAAALRAIPLDHQIVLELFYWETMTASEIGASLGRPQGTIRSLLRRAKVELSEALARVAESPELLASTLNDIERWIASLRNQIPPRRPRRKR